MSVRRVMGAETEFAHVLHGGRAVTAQTAEGRVLTGEDADFVGLPGLLSAEQTAALLSRRDADHRRRASSTRVDEGATDAEQASVSSSAIRIGRRRRRRRMDRTVAGRCRVCACSGHSSPCASRA